MAGTFFSSSAYAVNCQDLRDLGDELRYLLPLSAYGLTAGYRDGQGAGQYTKTLAYTGLATGIFKQTGEKNRPDAGTSQQSFVSGHVSASMSAAAFIYTRYGKGWGIPAYLLAGTVAYSRYCAQKHFDDDILGGTMVALMSNWYATSPYPDQAQVFPSFTSNDLRLSWTYAFGGNQQPRDPKSFRPRYKFTFEFGPLTQDTNLVQSPKGVGTLVDLAVLENKTAPTARLLFEFFPQSKPGQDWSIYYSPLGSTDFGTPTSAFDFAGETFDPAVDPNFNTNYRWFDWRARWRTELFQTDRWKIRAGAGLQFSYTKVEVEQGSRGQTVKQAEVSTNRLAPVIHGSVDFNVTRRWSLAGQIDGMSEFWNSGGGYGWNAGLFLKFAATPVWDLGIGGRWIAAKVDDSKLYNKFESTDLTFTLARAF